MKRIKKILPLLATGIMLASCSNGTGFRFAVEATPIAPIATSEKDLVTAKDFLLKFADKYQSLKLDEWELSSFTYTCAYKSDMKENLTNSRKETGRRNTTSAMSQIAKADKTNNRLSEKTVKNYSLIEDVPAFGKDESKQDSEVSSNYTKTLIWYDQANMFRGNENSKTYVREELSDYNSFATKTFYFHKEIFSEATDYYQDYASLVDENMSLSLAQEILDNSIKAVAGIDLPKDLNSKAYVNGNLFTIKSNVSGSTKINETTTTVNGNLVIQFRLDVNNYFTSLVSEASGSFEDKAGKNEFTMKSEVSSLLEKGATVDAPDMHEYTDITVSTK